MLGSNAYESNVHTRSVYGCNMGVVYLEVMCINAMYLRQVYRIGMYNTMHDGVLDYV